MSYTVKFDKSLNAVIMEDKEALWINDVIAYLDDVRNLLKVHNDANVIGDYTQASGSNIKTDELVKVTIYYETHRELFGHRKIANIAQPLF